MSNTQKANQRPYKLSKREMQVAKLLIAGQTIRGIAYLLGLKIKTVDSHIGTIYSKLELTNKNDICKRTVAVLKLKDIF